MNTKLCIGLAVGIIVATGSSVRAQCCEGGGGPTERGGLICENTTWDCSGSPYIVVNSIIVGCDATLTIEPGVEVRFKSNLGLTVGHITFGGGTLAAGGTEECPILFTSNAPYEPEPTDPAPGDWARIFFTDFATDAEFNEFDAYVSGSALEYATVEYAGGGEAAPVAITAENCSPYLVHCTVHDNASGGIGVNASAAGEVRIEHCEIFNCTVSGSGAGIYLTGGANHLLAGNNIHHCSASRTGNYNSVSGGGIYVNAAATLDGNTVTNNSLSLSTSAFNANANGGGIYVTGLATLSGNTVTGNSLSASGSDVDAVGGGIYVNGLATLSGNTVTDNSLSASGSGADAWGGGICLWSSSDGSTISNNEVTGNSANAPDKAWGGGIFLLGSANSTLEENSVTGNSASGADALGGGIDVHGSGNCTLTSNTVTGNSVNGPGGGISLWDSTSCLLSDNTVTGNSTSGGSAHGGGIFLQNSGTGTETDFGLRGNTVADNVITGNDAKGGGIFVWNSGNTILESNSVTRNNAPGAGADAGGIGVWNSTFCSLTGNTITDNTCGDIGGGLLFWNSGRWALESNVITDNTAVGNGGGIWFGNSGCAQTDPEPQCTMTDNVVARNHTNGETGGIYVLNSTWVSFAGDPETCSYNCICDNDGYCVYNDNPFDDAGSGDIDARYVIWCTENTQDIEDCIYDFFDDANLAIVVWYPFVPGDCENWEWAAWRDLSVPEPCYRPEVPKVISIQISPPVDATTINVEDMPPTGWTVSDISDGGVWDADTQKVKWGPFDTPFPKEVHYTVTPPADADGKVCFAGTISIDGGNLGICGDRCVESCSCPYIAADEQPQDVCTGCGDCTCATCEDGRVEMCELSGYACAWKRGCHDEGGLVSRAGFIWWNGECYCWDETTEPSNWWPRSCDEPDGCCAMPGTNDEGGQTVDAGEFLNAVGSMRTERAQVRADAGSGTLRGTTLDAARNRQAPAVRHWSAIAHGESVGSPATRGLPGPFCPESQFTVWIRLDIPPGISAVTLEDRPPNGWIATEWSDGCDWDDTRGKVKCGPYFEPFPEEIHYAAASPFYGNGTCFEGTIWLDGIPYPIEGEECVIVGLDDFAAWPGCMTGPSGGPYDLGCSPLDCEFDLDVDLEDFAAFQRIFGGP